MEHPHFYLSLWISSTVESLILFFEACFLKIQVFADMEELGVKPDEDTVRRIARAFQMLGQEDKQKLVLKKYQSRWKYIHFNGERARVRRDME